jgi:hypothetical protein
VRRTSIIALCAIVCTALLSLSYSYKKTSGSHPGSAGAPNDQTCAQVGCHINCPVILNATANNTLVFSSADSSYLPGQTYTLTLQVMGLAINPVEKFGFELVGISDSDSLNVGQFTLTEPSRTHMLSYAGLGSDTRYSVTHSTPGTVSVSTNYNEWTFTWTAPSTNEGNITFYWATNCSNNDNNENGDRIYLSSFKIHASSAWSVKEIEQGYEFNSFYDSEARSIRVNYDLKGTRLVALSIVDELGRTVVQRAAEKQSGVQKQKIDLSNTLSKGTYLVKLKIDGRDLTKKILVY